MKRYYLVERAKDAKIVGILVGTMGVAGYLECLSYMKRIAKFAGKKTYTFIMGKLTPEKLANFLEVSGRRMHGLSLVIKPPNFYFGG